MNGRTVGIARKVALATAAKKQCGKLLIRFELGKV